MADEVTFAWTTNQATIDALLADGWKLVAVSRGKMYFRRRIKKGERGKDND